MNCIIPFTKEVKFNSNISEILSISLEHDYTLNDYEILGNFIVSGEYKTHEVSVNKEKFEFVLPFSVSLTSKLKKESLEFNIEDFTYELLDENILKVEIEYSVKGEEEPENIVEFEKNESEDDNFEELLEEISNENKKHEESTKEELTREPKEENNSNKEIVLNEINKGDNTFVTYHIHILKDNETIENVCTKYNTTKDVLGEYNDLSNLTLGDKILIPEVNE